MTANQSVEVLRTKVPDSYDVVIQCHIDSDTYTVSYGALRYRVSTLAEAVAEAESCAKHALTCAGWSL